MAHSMMCLIWPCGRRGRQRCVAGLIWGYGGGGQAAHTTYPSPCNPMSSQPMLCIPRLCPSSDISAPHSQFTSGCQCCPRGASRETTSTHHCLSLGWPEPRKQQQPGGDSDQAGGALRGKRGFLGVGEGRGGNPKGQGGSLGLRAVGVEGCRPNLGSGAAWTQSGSGRR